MIGIVERREQKEVTLDTLYVLTYVWVNINYSRLVSINAVSTRQSDNSKQILDEHFDYEMFGLCVLAQTIF